MRTLLPLSLYCISLLCLQLHALPMGNRLVFKAILSQQKEGSAVFLHSEPSSDDPTNTPAVPLDRSSLWKALLHKNPPPSAQESSSSINPTDKSVESNRRARRSAYARGHQHQHGHLMRVGCVLGTCQVQKLSHRLYQLVGQNGREDPAPINPHSPHSYG